MTKTKKRSVLALAVAMLIAAVCAFAGCDKGGSGISPNEKYPEYASGKHMWIGGWDVPPNTQADYQMAKDMGLTHMFMDGAFARRDTEAYFDQLRHCEAVGLNAILGHDTATNNVDGTQMSEYDYSQFPAVDMINLWDEPYATNFAEVAARVDKAQEIYKANPDVQLYINLSPNHEMFSGETSNNIEEYLTTVEETVLDKIPGRRIYSTDLYPLQSRGGVNTLMTKWLLTMSIYATHAKANNGELHMFVQNFGNGTTRDIESKADLAFQINTDLVFGVTGISYFTYRQSFLGFTGGCVENNESCKPKESYYCAQEINRELAAWDEVYMSFDWDGVFTVLGSENLKEDDEYQNMHFIGLSGAVDALDCAKSVSATQDTIIGQFKDKDGNAALMITNYTEPTDLLSDTVEITFNNANRALVYKNGKRTVYEVKKNKVKINLATGEGAFVIPVKV
ncbi:MAG: hypothetical protein K2L51_02895 [Clostridiales bacterium]|nr:hypothetical protein [Clostridiales bacterium]